jgi:hypothetical protein
MQHVILFSLRPTATQAQQISYYKKNTQKEHKLCV